MGYSVKTLQVTSVGTRLWNTDCTLLASVFAQSLRVIHLIPVDLPIESAYRAQSIRQGEGGGVNYQVSVYSIYKAHTDSTGVLTWVEDLNSFSAGMCWNFPIDLKECLEFLFYYGHCYFSQRQMNPPVLPWLDEESPWLAHRQQSWPVFPSMEEWGNPRTGASGRAAVNTYSQ